MNKLKVVIVESPAKAKTINKFLGKDYSVVSSFGHICDLPAKSLAVDIEKNFSPQYEVSSEKKRVVRDLMSATKNAEAIYLASDDDREGEAISWHLKEVLNLPSDKTQRIIFHEVTEKAIKQAIKNPRDIDMNLVNSQQARRILDRLVGYMISPVLWAKIKKGGLSAGRVQSVAVRLIVEREREIDKFKSKSYFRISAVFKTDHEESINAEMEDADSITKDEAYDILGKIKNNADSFVVDAVNKKTSSRSPIAPFTTSTLQQEASSKLGFSVSQTMLLAQHLYEAGKISYMRTDSVILSEDAISQAEDVIRKDFGEEYVQKRQFKNKSKLAQAAHEAIRPTHFEDVDVSDDEKEQKLYTLIRRRAIASQMADAIIDKTTIKIKNKNIDDVVFVVNEEIVSFPGFLKLYNSNKNDGDGEYLSHDVNEGMTLQCISSIAKEKFTQHPARYSEASLVKELEARGIGRPSTYATIITTVQKRGYVVKESREGIERQYAVWKLEDGKIIESVEKKIEGSEKNKLFPTDIAYYVNDFIVEYFPDITDYKFTASIEKKLDDVAEAKENWVEMLKDFYTRFHKELQNSEGAGRVVFKERPARFLGTDPETGKNIYVARRRYGPVMQIGEGAENTHYYSLLPWQGVDTITLDEALLLKTFPKEIGEYKGKNIILRNGSYGPYLEYNGKNMKVYDCSDIFNFTLERAIDIIEKALNRA